MTPKLGMHFDDLDEAYNFYNAYGKLAGFSIRKESTNRGKDGEVVWKRFVCSKQVEKLEKALMKKCIDLQWGAIKISAVTPSTSKDNSDSLVEAMLRICMH
ncbi:hypothetical protein MRB53_020913 [Persea americana]|uniref:Uncharacterized protein n=1 Tax=Persea americana TaxID=3435 RepID=A0ACC2L354_PERAE|nr:hypothetical protein MRB53_020913 [Persea americana]